MAPRALPLRLLLACRTEVPRRTVTDVPLDTRVRGARPEEVARFREGDALFGGTLRAPDGLGPLHHVAAPAGERPFGHAVRPFTAGGATTPVLAPDGGRGAGVAAACPAALRPRLYLEAVKAAELLLLEAAQAGGTYSEPHVRPGYPTQRARNNGPPGPLRREGALCTDCVSPEQQITEGTRTTVDARLKALEVAARAATAAAPRRTRTVGTQRRTRKATAVLFPHLDASTDGRHDATVLTAPDANLFDGKGFTGVPALERCPRCRRRGATGPLPPPRCRRRAESCGARAAAHRVARARASVHRDVRHQPGPRATNAARTQGLTR